MKHYLILSPSIYFYENQTLLIDSMLKNKHKLNTNKEGQFFNFVINGQEYTFIISKYSQCIVYFIKGSYLEHSFKSKDIIFKSHFNLVQSAKVHKIILDKEMSDYDDFFSPNYNNIGNRYDMRSYSTFDKIAFKDFCSLFNDKPNNNLLGVELYNIYLKDYCVVKNTVSFVFEDLYKTLKDSKFKGNQSFEEMIETGLFVKSDNFILESRDSSLDAIEFKDNKIIFYHVDKDEYFSNFTDDDYEDSKTVFFDDNDLYKMDCNIKNRLREFELGILSKEMFAVEPCNLFYILISIENTNKYLFKEYGIINEKKIVKIEELQNVNHTLLCSTSHKWHKGELYNPNKIIDVDVSSLETFVNNPSFKHATLFVNPLLISYDKNINTEFFNAIDIAVKYAYNLIEQNYKSEDQKSLKKMSLKNIEEIANYHQKTVAI